METTDPYLTLKFPKMSYEDEEITGLTYQINRYQAALIERERTINNLKIDNLLLRNQLKSKQPAESCMNCTQKEYYNERYRQKCQYLLILYYRYVQSKKYLIVAMDKKIYYAEESNNNLIRCYEKKITELLAMKESRIKDIGRTKTYWKSDTDHEGLLAMAMVDSGKAKSKKMKNLATLVSTKLSRLRIDPKMLNLIVQVNDFAAISLPTKTEFVRLLTKFPFNCDKYSLENDVFVNTMESLSLSGREIVDMFIDSISTFNRPA